MKNRVIIILTTVLASMILFSGNAFAQYSDRYGYEDEYRFDNNVYDDNEYWLDNSAYHLDRCQGPVYYYYHPAAGVYFVSIGNITFVVPAYQFRPYMHRHNFFLVPRSRFISLSCGGLDYYDNYLRFNFYFDFFNRNRWDRKYHHSLRYDYRKYYNNRHHNSWYEKNRRVVMKQRISPSHNNSHSYSNRGDSRYDSHSYSNRGDSRYDSHSYSNRGGSRYDSHSNRGGSRSDSHSYSNRGGSRYNSHSNRGGSRSDSRSYRGGNSHKSGGFKSYNHGNTGYSKKYNYSKSSSSSKTYHKNSGSHKYGKDRH